MTNASRILAGLLALPILSYAVEDCKNEGEQPLEFRFFTDTYSWKDNGWTLECDYDDGDYEEKALIWEVPIGSLPKESKTQVIREAACVPNTATCTLRIFDASGDGLESTRLHTDENGAIIGQDEERFTGWFAFLHGATTVGTYQNVANPAFSELTYCVGPNCEQEPQEVQSNDENCQDIVYLTMKLDGKPQDTSYQLVCNDNNVIWDGKDFTKAGAYIEEQACLPKDACCEFVVSDDSVDGLTAGGDAFIYVEWNFQPVMEYDSVSGEVFDQLSADFGCGDSADVDTMTNTDDMAHGIEESEEDVVVTEEEEPATEDVPAEDVEEWGSPATSMDVSPNENSPATSMDVAPIEDDQIEIPFDGPITSMDVAPITDDDDFWAEGPGNVFVDDDDWRYPNEFWGDESTSEPTSDGSEESTYYDDFYATSEPTSYSSEEATNYDDYYATSEPSEEAPYGDAALTAEQMQSLEDMVAAADNKNPHLPSSLPSSNKVQQNKGISEAGAISVGVIAGVVVALIILALYYFRDTLSARFGFNKKDNEDKAESESEQSSATGPDDKSVIDLVDVAIDSATSPDEVPKEDV